MTHQFLSGISDPMTVTSAIDASARFPEILTLCRQKYQQDIANFKSLICEVASSEDLLRQIRSPRFNADERMSLLKIFRRAVSPVLDTEAAKKTRAISTESLIDSIGSTFKQISLLRDQFGAMSPTEDAALAALLGEYDTRGRLGYMLTERFFDWFESSLGRKFSIEGPRGAGPDIELSTVFPDFSGSYPCDFIIRERATNAVVAIGFARYDSTRGGGQSDDRTGGNSDKVGKAKEFFATRGGRIRIIFVSDGPGLAHKDTWAEACSLDGCWDGNVRVTTLKLLSERITEEWLTS